MSNSSLLTIPSTMRVVLMFTVAVVAAATGTPTHQLHPGSRIVGGVNATIDDVPHFLQLEYQGSLRCGASIYNAHTAITSGSCVYGASVLDVQMREGSDISGSGGTLHQAVKVISHPQYSLFDYDIGLVIVSEPFNARNAIPLAVSKPYTNAPVIVAGMGMDNNSIKASGLQTMGGYIMDHEECRSSLQSKRNITERMICTYPSNSYPSEFDHGGPIEHRGELVGVVAYINYSDEPEVPKVYTDVVELREWIQDNAA